MRRRRRNGTGTEPLANPDGIAVLDAVDAVAALLLDEHVAGSPAELGVIFDNVKRGRHGTPDGV